MVYPIVVDATVAADERSVVNVTEYNSLVAGYRSHRLLASVCVDGIFGSLCAYFVVGFV